MKKSIKKTLFITAFCVSATLSATLATAFGDNKCAKTACDITANADTLVDVNMGALTDMDIVQTAVLKQGSKGNEVKEVQRRLKMWGYYKGSADGVFGAGTKNAVIAFQKKNGLKADGVVGASTYKALGMTGSYNVLINQNKGENTGNAGNTSNTNGFSSSEVYLLAKTIYAEGRGEPYSGQVAIGAVVLNRVRSKQFPNTIAGVVYQKHAFTAVSDGQINLTPNETAMKAARDAINGWDPTGGALYYYNPAVATSSWIFGRETITVIGKHVFAI